MTDDEFKSWTRHTAENLQQQRDAAIAQSEAGAAELAAIKAAHAAELAAKDAERTQAVADAVSPLQTQITTLQAKVDEQAALILAMGGTAVGKQLAKQKRLAELTAAKQSAIDAAAKADAEITDLNK